MTSKKISLLGLTFILALSMALGPLVSSAQTASSTDNSTNSSTSSSEMTATTSSNTDSTTMGNFVLVDSRVDNSDINQNQTATVEAVVKSQNASTPNVQVDMSFLDENNHTQGTTTTISGKDFPKDEPVTLTATSPANLSPGKYHVSVNIFSSDRSQKLVTFENVQSFTVSSPTTSATTTATTTENNNGSSGTSTTGNISSVNTSNIGSTDGTITFNLSGLTPATNYTFIGSLWQNGNLLNSRQQDFTSTSNSGGSGTTTGSSSLEISSVSATSNSNGDGATITWNTNFNADSQVMFGTTANYSSSSTVDSTGMTNHSVNINDLTPNTLYHFKVISKDTSGMTTTSQDQTFTTNSTSGNNNGGGSGNGSDNGGGGTTTSNLNISSVVGTSNQDGTSATINWTTDVNADSQVVFGASANNYTSSSTLNSSQTTNHTVTISGLTPGTLYHFQVISTDSSGNKITSQDMVLSTNGTNSGTNTLDTNTLQNRIVQLQEQIIALLQQRIQTLISENNNM